MNAFPGISHEDLLKLVFSLAVLLASARFLGELARRVKQPAVVGEILAGVILGPSLLSSLLPRFGEWLLPQTESQSHLLDTVALVGILFLMVVVGLETDLGLIRSRWRTAVGVGVGGLIIPFAAGLWGGTLVPASLLDGGDRLVFALFLAVALALSAIPVLARVLTDLGLMRNEFGQTVLAAGMIDDIVGWSLLGIVTSLAASGTMGAGDVLRTLGGLTLFFLATLVIARPVTGWLARSAVDRASGRDMVLTVLVATAFGWGAFSQWLHLEPILGAFAVGVIGGQLRKMPLDVTVKLESVTNAVFAPIFLATAGLRLRLDVLAEPELLLLAGALLLLAAIGKLAGGYLGGRLLARTSHRDALGYGIALNARGVLGIVVATLGLSMGVFGVEVYSMVVVVSVLTSILTPMGLRWLYPSGADPDSPDRSPTRFGRVLVPVRMRPDQAHELRALEASVINTVTEPDADVLLLTAIDEEAKPEAEEYLRDLRRLFRPGLDVRRKVVRDDPLATILETASRGYEIMALGAPEPDPRSDFLIAPLIDDVIRLAPCPTMVFSEKGGSWPPRTIMVPTGGGAAALRAAELAFAIAGRTTEVVLLHVVDTEGGPELRMGTSTDTGVRLQIGQDIVTELRRMGEARGVRVSAEVLMGGSVTANVIQRAGRSVDLMIIGTHVRSGSHRLFLGPRVEHMLRELPCSVILLNT